MDMNRKQQDWAHVDAQQRAKYVSNALNAAEAAWHRGDLDEARQYVDSIAGVLQGGPKNLPRDEKEQFNKVLRKLGS